MKRIFCMMLAVLLLALSVSSCKNGTTTADTTAAVNEAQGTNAAEKADFIISEKFFVSYINDIYSANYTKYVGKTIQIEGMYKMESSDDGDMSYVYRIGPGCCGNDGSTAGFEFTYDGEMPAEKDWIRVVGILESYELNGDIHLNIKANSVTVLPESQRGAEIVS